MDSRSKYTQPICYGRIALRLFSWICLFVDSPWAYQRLLRVQISRASGKDSRRGMGCRDSDSCGLCDRPNLWCAVSLTMQGICNIHIQWLEIWNRTQATIFWKFAIALHWVDT
jgi:hypothetical protein